MISAGSLFLASVVLARPATVPRGVPTLDELRGYLAATAATKAESEAEIASRFQDAVDARSAISEDASRLFGWWLFTRGRLREALPLMERTCLGSADERTCAAAASIHVAAGNWRDGAFVARTYLDRACAASDRLLVVVKLQSKPEIARTAAEGLVRLEGDHEMSYLLLAAAHHLLGDTQRSREALEAGKRRLPRAFVLDRVQWSE